MQLTARETVCEMLGCPSYLLLCLMFECSSSLSSIMMQGGHPSAQCIRLRSEVGSLMVNLLGGKRSWCSEAWFSDQEQVFGMLMNTFDVFQRPQC